MRICFSWIVLGVLIVSVLSAHVAPNQPPSSVTDKIASTSSASTVIDLWGGGSESIALMSNGTVWTWGWDDYGILGNGHGLSMMTTTTTYDSNIPYQVLGQDGVGHLNSIAAIAGGEHHNVALDTNGEVWTWGWNYFKQLGNGIDCPGDFLTAIYSTDCQSTTPIKMPGFTNVKAIASRGYHSLALKQDGTVWAWGRGDWGLLGDGFNQARSSPVQVVGLTGHGTVSALSSGGEVNVALMSDRTLLAWGRNDHGQVGNGMVDTSDTGQWTPVSVVSTTGLTTVAQVATGWAHSVALDPNGNVWTWGANDEGELGNGTTISSSVPIKVNGVSNVIGISAGDGSTVVLEANGTVWAWGTLRTGDLAHFSNYYYGPTPVQVAGIDQVTLIRARDWHVLALKSDGTVWCWGWNEKGQCGDGTTGGDKTVPVQVLFPTAPFTPTAWLYLPLVHQ